MKRFYVSAGLPGTYGQRVFLHEDYVRSMLKGTQCFQDQLPPNPTHPVAKVLRENCPWGGADKCWEGWYGYELPCDPADGERALWAIQQVLTTEGFEKLTVCPWS